jgi:tetratricopeptide (TPR) repeat protein/O-antigen ligase
MLAWLGIAPLLGYLVFIGGASSGLLYPWVWIANLALVAAVLGVWAVAARQSPTLRPSTKLTAAIVAALVAFALASLASISWRLSVEFLAKAIILVALYLLLVRVVADGALRVRVMFLAGALCVTICLLYLVVVVHDWIGWWAVVGHIAIPPLRPSFETLGYGDPGGVAAIAILLASPVVATLALQSGRGRIAAVALVLLVGLVTFLTGARGAWLGLAVATVAAAVAVLASKGSRDWIRAHTTRERLRWLVPVVAALVVVAALAAPTILRRIAEGGGGELRSTLVQTAVRMFQEDPLTGSGPGTWVVRRAAFTVAGETDYYIPHAHNIFAQTAAEFGLVGIVAGLVGLVVIGRLIPGALRDGRPIDRAIAIAAISSLTYWAVHQLVDMQVDLPSIVFAAILPIALLDAPTSDATGSRETEPPPGLPAAAETRARRLALATYAGLAVACVAALGVLAVIDVRALGTASIAPKADAGDWQGALTLARDAAAQDPGLPANHFLYGLAAARTGDSETAASELRLSADADDFVFAWLDLAALDLKRGDQATARTDIDKAMRLGQQQAAIALPAGSLYLALGDEDAARTAFAIAIIIAPPLADDPYWHSTTQLDAIYPSVIDEALKGSGPESAAFIALLAGRPDTARSIAAGLDDVTRPATELAIAAWAGDEAAQAELVAEADRHPLDTRPVVWLARLATRAEDWAATDRYESWVAIATGIPGTDIGQDVVVTDSPIVGAQVPGSNGNLQGWYVYRRQYPWDLVVPGLPKLTLR